MSEAPRQQIAFVSGGSRGIGRAIVERLTGDGLHVCFSYLSNAERAAELVAGLHAQGRSAEAVCVDSRSVQASSAALSKLIGERGRLDVLVNNAAVTADKLLPMMGDADWSLVLETSLNGLYATSKVASKQMMRQRAGRIINITSVSGVMGVAGQTNYSTAKAGIIGFTRSLAKELARWDVPVNAVAPGYVDTDMLSYQTPEQRSAALSAVPMRRFGHVDEIATVVRFLALEAPSYLTGQTLVVDGGLSG